MTEVKKETTVAKVEVATKEEVPKVPEVPKQASLVDCLKQMNKIRQRDAALAAEEAAAIAEVRRNLAKRKTT